MRKVFLDDLPRNKRFGINKDNQVIDWVNSVGHEVRFIYDDIDGILHIKECNTHKQSVLVEHQNIAYWIGYSNIKRCQLGGILGVWTGHFKIKIGSIFDNLIITDRQYIFGHDKNNKAYNYKWYKYTCSKCGWTEGWIKESDLLNGQRCSCCRGLTVVYGINSIHDTAPWMIDLGVDFEEAKNFSYGSNKKIKCTCPHCKKEFYKQCKQISCYKSICCTCGDGFSYPEKFMYSVLEELGLKFQTQLTKSTFEWVDDKRYDFYIPSLNMIIETHGLQHYKDMKGFMAKKLKKQKHNDLTKKLLALSNGIQYYIELNCSESKFEWVKNSIISSKLNEIFDLSKIDWFKCEEFALNNLVKEICNYWNNKKNYEGTTDVMDKFNLSRSTVVKYLRQGDRLGWCNYDAEKESLKGRVKAGKSSGKKVGILKNGNIFDVFDSSTELERQSEDLFGVKLRQQSISRVCNGVYKQYKGFTFQYI